MKRQWPFTPEKLGARLKLIAPYVHRRRSILPHFRILPLLEPMLDAPICGDPTLWDEIPHESYWGHADLNFVMKSTFQVPDGWDATNLALHLPLGLLGDVFNHPEAMVHVDRIPIGSADRYHHTIRLDPDVADGAPHVLSLHGWTGLAGWPPEPNSKSKLFMGVPALVERDPVLLELVQLAQTVLDTATTLDNATGAAVLDILDHALRLLDTRDPIGDALYSTAPEALSLLKAELPSAGDPLDITLHGIGHAHMDIAYLWTVDQIRLKNARTYTNVLRLMEDDPDFQFSHSQPQLYAYTAKDYPALFDKIKERVAEGRWEVMGGMWVEPDLNVIGAESLIRQLTLGRGYFSDTFGAVETPVLWLPDTFGFPAQIPQLMQLAGLDWFVTNKLNWNQLNQIASSTHHWEGLDGSRVLAHVLSTPRDVQYLPFPTNYKSDLTAPEVLGTVTRCTSPQSVRDLPICFGYGDGGGGPTEDLLAKAQAFKSMPGMPQFKYSNVRDMFDAIKDTPDLPVWQGEHYMEGHRGTYTSQGWIKRANRKAEWALHEAEAMAVMAGQNPDLTEAWQLLCLNQFHDIITGTSIGQVFDDTRGDFANIRALVEDAASTAAKALAGPEPRAVNTAPTTGPRLALFGDNTAVKGQTTAEGTLAFFDDLPGYCVVPISAAVMPKGEVTARKDGARFILENPLLRVVLTPDGTVSEVFDKRGERSVLADGSLGNQLLAFEDRPICWDAWDIDPSYEEHCALVTGDTIAEIVETGPLRATIHFVTRWRHSEIRQSIQLRAHSARLDFVTDVDWHEQHTLLKAAFSTTLVSDTASYDTQWGRVSRSTRRDTDFDAARFEVPAQKWACLTDKNLGVAVLNDCKYGYDVLGGRIRITLIKSATAPDPNADQGGHRFTYALLPFDADQPEQLDHEAYDLNAPLRVLETSASDMAASKPVAASSARNVIIETIKPANADGDIVLRMFEAHGVATTTELTLGFGCKAAHVATIFEDPIAPLALDQNRVAVTLKPFEIKTVKFSRA
ncbi:glycoside hydrolase family 38 C-terminal domain-containing protein [Cognatishimia sp. MH4019]|uniref:alpha-mannosidase n=1 Tax=Cognatishimia sp. MH4019 TaxID=2854030 RepID=UPI001CD39420|nr:glycoside hydrolase family 38 C-terminal domain-containing protein [Cognatishimia sp. MH4019]